MLVASYRFRPKLLDNFIKFMIQHGTILNVVDKTGVIMVQCIKVFGSSKKRIAFLGDVVLVVIKKVSAQPVFKGNVKKKRKFFQGRLVRALIVRSKVNYERLPGFYINFNENSVVLVSKKTVPLSRRAYGPILKELCIKVPALGYISRFII